MLSFPCATNATLPLVITEYPYLLPSAMWQVARVEPHLSPCCTGRSIHIRAPHIRRREGCRAKIQNIMSYRATRLPFGSITRHVGVCPFSTTSARQVKNRIYPSRVRREDELHTLTLMSARSRVPLLTLWMATWCQSCKVVSPLICDLIGNEGVGEEHGGVSFVEVEMDSPDLGGIAGAGTKYGINSLPTMLAFDRQEPQLETKLSRLEQLKNREFLIKWIETEAKRHGEGGAGGKLFGLFGR